MQSDKTKLFIEKARAIHGDRYGYSLVEYVRRKDKVKIICKEHGAFKQAPAGHLNGNGCYKCGNGMKSTDEFIRLSRIKHGDKYDYSLTKFVHSSAKLEIICKLHGVFTQKASAHQAGHGCISCGFLKTGEFRLSNTEDFIGKSKNVHGDLYDYSKVIYRRATLSVDISCAVHGVFKKTPQRHLVGQGCPSCQFDRNRPTLLYILTNGKGQCKIGISIDLDRRMRQQAKDQSFTSTLKTTWELPDFDTAYAIEQGIHKKLKHLNCGYIGFDGATEWFDISPHKAVKEVGKAVVAQEQIQLF